MDIKIVKAGLKLIFGGLVSLFTGAVTDCVLTNTSGSKIAKLGAKAGGALVSFYIGEKVTESIMDSVEEYLPEPVQEVSEEKTSE